MNAKLALLIGNSDGIGKKTTHKLLEMNYRVIGISKSPLVVDHPNYRHIVEDVSSLNFKNQLSEVLLSLTHIDLCVYFAGIGNEINWQDLSYETKVFEVNLMGAVKTTELVLTHMLKQGHGHFIGLSSIADVLISTEAPSYSASKSGVSKFWEGLGLANQNRNVKISNIRFGFVDTKMAKSPIKPFLLSIDEAVDFILDVIKRPRIRATKPKIMLPLAWLLAITNHIRLWFK